jgi:glycosyltransferase involved in cell wall biosynthesis
VQSPLRDLSALMELIHLYRVQRPDIVHHVALKQVLFGAIAARIVRVPAMVNAITGLGYMFQSGSARRTLLRSVIAPVLRWALARPGSAVIFQNKDDCEDLVRTGLVSTSQAVIIRGAGVNVSQFRPSPEPDGVPIVILASRLLRDKGVGEFVTAARLLKRIGIHARYVLVGMVDSENPSSFTEEEVRGWVNEGVVEWWGHRDDMTDVFASSHIVVLPSYAEGLPKVLLEAAACARPLIATRVRGCQEIVRDGVNGLLVPLKEPHALAQAVMTLVQSKTLRERMGARGREIAVNEFRVELIADETIAVYDRLLGNGYAPSHSWMKQASSP